ncbi:MAG: HlyD family efflux transporter periplasmic adaptor subunit [Phycisphaerales bacterium]|nr:MAG: HlyD family efflux transporter periplasmic adaptor subunit [Phycisphaerales bacterium]
MTRQNKKNRLKPVLAVVLPILLIVTVAAVKWSGGGDVAENIPTFEVKRGPLTISIDASGTIQALDQIVITCKVKGEGGRDGGGVTILTLVPEGTRVKKGDLLVELDSSSFEDQLVAEQIALQTAETALVSAQETLEVGKNQAESDLEQAQLALDFAIEDLRKYKEGDYQNELTDAESQIVVKEEAEQQAADKYKWSQQLFAEKYISETELKADELALSRASLEVKLAKSQLQLLKDFTYQRQIKQLESDKWQAGMALERAKRKAKADVVLLEAALYEAQSNLERQKEVVKKLQTNITNTLIFAPADGMVVYATSQDHHRHNDEPLDVGQQVRERQELIHLPTSDKVRAEVKVHESSMQKVKVGLPVVVTVDAVQEKMFTGKVVKIAMLPDAQMVWLNPDLKIYSTEIHLDEDGTGLRTGMSCRASIVVDQYEDVVYIPVQAVVRIGDQPTAYVMKEGKTEPRKVEIGLDNNRMVHVISGLEPGEEVILTPPLAPAEAQEAKARDALRQTDAPDMPGGESGGREPRGRPGPPGRSTPAGPRDT